MFQSPVAMMKSFLVALVLVVSSTGIASSPCDEGWSFFKTGNKCVKVFTDTKSWNDAAKTCAQTTGRLVVIPDNDTQQFVNNLVGKETLETWIGLNDQQTENVYRWADGSQACGFQYWGKNEPNNLFNEDCVHLLTEPTHHWNDKNCDILSPYICEKKGPGCEYRNGGCSDVCSQDGWNVKCSCFDGFAASHGGICMDLDECSVENGGCDQLCENAVGSFQCQCYSDFVYNGTQCVMDTDDTVIG